MTRVALVSNGDSADPRTWSGTPWFARREVERRFPGTAAVDTPRVDAALRAANGLLRRLGIGLDLAREPLVTRAYGRHLRRAVRRCGADVVVSVGASHKACDAELDVPVVHVSDALFDTITGYYGRYAQLSERSRRRGSAVQRRLLARCSTLLLASQWAADDARRSYDLGGVEVVVAPLGANLVDPPDGPLPPGPRTSLDLLFVGYDWQRKGGPLAVQVLRELVAAGVPATLTVVGCRPPGLPPDLPVRAVGRLDQGTPAGARELRDHLARAALLLVPSGREAFGLVFAEAAASSRPSVALRTGGVPTAVLDGVTGLLFDPGTSAPTIARAVRELWEDEPAYAAMCASARAHYEARLSWTAWGTALEASVDRAVRSAR